MSRTLNEWLDWQLTLHPKNIELGLERCAKVWSRLAAPMVSKVITVAGTNGKGSSVAFLEAMYLSGGYSVACYTSPHIHAYNERIRINGVDATDADICQAFTAIDEARAEISLTYFEFGTLAALWLFSKNQPEVVILEVGLGGRLDAVNIIDADAALITSIALDHQDWLGDDLEVIAGEKAGIMRANKPAVYASSPLPKTIKALSLELGNDLYVYNENYTIEKAEQSWSCLGLSTPRRALPIPSMRGDHQLRNAAGVLKIIDCLHSVLPLDQTAIREGLLAAKVPGRFELYRHVADWILDVAHNPQAAGVLSDLLGEQYCAGNTYAIVGMLADKDVSSVVQLLAKRIDHWHLLDLSGEPRGLSADQLAEQLEQAGVTATCTPHEQASQILEQLLPQLTEQDRVVVFGSFYTVAAIRSLLAYNGDIIGMSD